MLEKIPTFFKYKLTENLIVLYAAYFVRYLLPLITIPYLARVLGVEMWGILAFILAYSSFAGLFIEFGFGL